MGGGQAVALNQLHWSLVPLSTIDVSVLQSFNPYSGDSGGLMFTSILLGVLYQHWYTDALVRFKYQFCPSTPVKKSAYSLKQSC